MSATAHDGETLPKGPLEILVKHFDWDEEGLAAGVSITTATMAVEGLSGDTTATPLTLDQVSLLTGSRKVQFRTTAGAAGSIWRVSCQILTNELPAQTKKRSIYISVVER